jgi:membrane protease YdiL (CAAX protease family)
MSFPPGRFRAIQAARRVLARFLIAIPFLLVVPVALRFRWGGPAHPTLDFALLVVVEWVPTLAAVIALLPEWPHGLGLGPPRSNTAAGIAISVLAPLAVALASYGIAWSAQLAPFIAPEAPAWVQGGTWGAMAHGVGVHLMRGFGAWLLFAFGEEIGWRGFLVVQLKRADLPLPLLAGGLIWSAWHWPSMLIGSYPAGPNPVLSVLLLTVTLTSFSYVLSALRIATGSMWPAAFAHALWNSFFFDSFEGATRSSNLWTRESGLLTAAASIVVAALTLLALGPTVRAGGPAIRMRRRSRRGLE